MNTRTAGADQAYRLLSAELEMLVREDALLLKIAGVALMFLSRLEGTALPAQAAPAADLLADLITEIPDDTLCEALQLANS